jgi:hypothetical protein
MTVYIFRAGDRGARIALSRSEGMQYRRMKESPDWEVPLFGIAVKGMLCQRTRDDLLVRASRLLASLEEQAPLLRFTYTLASAPNPMLGPPRFRGQSVSVECGPGFCHLVTSEIVQAPGARAPAIVTHQVADLRNLEPVVLDDGQVLRATRRRANLDLVAKVRELKAFLDASDAGLIECSAE